MTIPQHIAIIMDGNGRWAKARGLNRSVGHQAGVETVKRITEECAKLGVNYLTLYTFSTENWNRPADEVAALMSLVLTAMEEELFMKNNVRLHIIGELSRVPQEVREAILNLQERTQVNTGMTMVIALSYSSRWEITDTVQRLAEKVKAGVLAPEDITEECISNHLATNFMPDPDLLIRTGGECRLSNYLLWQCAYTEFYFCDTYWPDFNAEDLQLAIEYFNRKERRFGKTSEQVVEQANS
ncbi:MAG: isoprenyl transferase [Bacteroidaceae bacterium]|jgi:undecaprenyl diphosphate synthase|nr:isoprenyl transferase [Bacteroidaceae bacterium]